MKAFSRPGLMLVASAAILATVSVVRVKMVLVYGSRRLYIAPCCLDSEGAVEEGEGLK